MTRQELRAGLLQLVERIGLHGVLCRGVPVRQGNHVLVRVTCGYQVAVRESSLYAFGVEPEAEPEFSVSLGGTGEVEDSETVGSDEVCDGLCFFFSRSR